MNLTKIKLIAPILLALSSPALLLAGNFQVPQTNSSDLSNSYPEQDTIRDPFTPSRLMY